MTREELRFGEEVSQTLKFLTVTRPELIDNVVKHLVEGIPATTLAGRVNCAQIYRAKNQYLRLRENIAYLNESATCLYAVPCYEPDAEPFPVTLNVNRAELSSGFLWRSIRNQMSYRTTDLTFFTLSGDEYIPYCIV